ncbi:MAG: hypothetical protein Kow0080_17800 [Candidatus Promineifilaceae bacterium]
MKIRTEPLLGGALFAIVISLTSAIINAISVSKVFNVFATMPLTDPTFDPTTSAQFESTINNIMQISSIMSLVSCLLWLVAGLGAGIVYTVLHHRQEKLIGGAPKGGAASGALGFFVSSLIGGLIQLVITSSAMRDFMAVIETAGAPPVNLTSAMIILGIVGALCSGIFMAGVGALLGALGGMMGSMFTRSADTAVT